MTSQAGKFTSPWMEKVGLSKMAIEVVEVELFWLKGRLIVLKSNSFLTPKPP